MSSLGIRSPFSYIETADTLIPMALASSSLEISPLSAVNLRPISLASITLSLPLVLFPYGDIIITHVTNRVNTKCDIFIYFYHKMC